MPARACPTCTRPMQPLYADRIELDRCFPCAATWFDPGEFERVSGGQGAPTMTREQPACRCPGCGEDLWFARLEHCDVLACVGCGGFFVTDVQARRAAVDAPAPKRQRDLRFVCVGCGDRYPLSKHQRVEEGLACSKCAGPPPTPQAQRSKKDKRRKKDKANPRAGSSDDSWGWLDTVEVFFFLFELI